MSNVACDQCGGPVDNTGTVCTGCLQSVLQTAGFKGLVQVTSAQRKTLLQPAQPARPLLLMKGTPVSATPNDVIFVEYTAKVYVGIASNGGVEQVVWANDQKPEPTGNLVAYDPAKNKGDGAYVSAGVPEPPPKFTSVEEAEEWLEANTGKSAYDVEVTAERAHQVREAASQVTISDWL